MNSATETHLSPWRSWASTTLLVVGFVLTVLAGPVLYVSSVIDDEDAFVAVADDVAAHPVLRDAVAEQVTTITFDALAADEVLAEILPEQARTFSVPITRLATSQLTTAAFTVLDTDVAVDARDTALREVHRQVTTDSDEVIIDLRAVLVRTSRELGGPTVGAGVAKFVSGSDTGRFTIAEAGSSTSQLLARVRAVPGLGGLVGLAAVVALIVAVPVAQDRRTALIRAGLVLAAAALVSTLVVSVVLFMALDAMAGGSPIGAAVAEVISADFAQQQRGAIGNGLVLAGIGLLLGNRPSAVALRRLPGDLWHRRGSVLDSFAAIVGDNPPAARAAVWVLAGFGLATWSTPTWRVVLSVITLTTVAQVFVWLASTTTPRAAQARRAVGVERWRPAPLGGSTARLRVNLAAVVASAFFVWPTWSRSLLITFFVIIALTMAALDARPARHLATRRGEDDMRTTDASNGPITRRRAVVAGVVGAGAIALGVMATAGSAEQNEAATGCNGHVELCDRQVNEVVFAGSHNAMSSTALGWDLAMQDGDIVAQLDHGIRALLIDALYWDTNGSIEGGGDAAASTIIEAALSDDQPRPGTWLCHGFCALGATDLVSGLADIAIWLDEHPREVLLIVVQDEISENDLRDAFAASGLDQHAHVHQAGTPFPTLGELIDLDERLLVYGENQGQTGNWFQNAFLSAFTETPFTFALRSEFSCDPNRGDPDNPLFLINHWLTTGIPVREATAAVNSRDALLARVRQCETERGRLPTVLATDFVETGDLIAVVNELNDIDEHHSD